MVSFCVFQKNVSGLETKLIMPIDLCILPTSIFLPLFMCNGAVVCKIHGFNRKKKKKKMMMMMKDSKIGPYHSTNKCFLREQEHASSYISCCAMQMHVTCCKFLSLYQI